MSTITVDDEIRLALESLARACGLTLADYLKRLAQQGAPEPNAGDDERQRTLHERLKLRIAAAEALEFEQGVASDPRRATGDLVKAGASSAEEIVARVSSETGAEANLVERQLEGLRQSGVLDELQL